MDRHRGGDRYSDIDNDNNYNTGSYNSTIDNQDSSYHNRRPSRFSDAPSRFSDSPINRYSDNCNNNNYSNYNRRSPYNYRGGGGGRRPFDSPPRRSPPGGVVGGDGGFRPMGGGGGGGGGFRPIGSGGGGFGPTYQVPPPLPLPPQNLSGRKRGFHGNSPDRYDGGGGGRSGFAFAKLFVGSVPRTATEMDIRPMFEEHGNVIEVALIKDKRTGQQQGCCFIKYATSEEADRAIRALHNQRTLPGGVGPIQVRYADGERERLVEYKLFVGSLNKQATEKEVEEIFTPYGRVEDVYLMRDEMKHSRGCGFVKYSDRDMAMAAINGLNGIFTMRGCEQPLTVRFADPKRPRPGGDSRGGPGGGSRFQAAGLRPPPNLGDPMGDPVPANAWHLMSPQNMGPSPNAGVHGFGNQLPPRSGDLAMPLSQIVNQSLQQPLPVNQQISPLQKLLQSPQNLLPSLQLAQAAASYSQTQTSHVSQLQSPLTSGQTPFSQALASQHLIGLSGQLSAPQLQIQQGISSTTALQAPLNTNLQSHSMSAAINQQQLPAPVQQQLLQTPSQLAQMLSQQTQTLQASFQSSQQAFSQLQQQLQMMQPSNQSTLQLGPQAPRQQWPPQAVASTPTLPADAPPSTSAPTAGFMSQTVAPVKCNWTEHTSPEGFKYYYNSVTHESRWEKPEELKLFEQQQQQQLHQKPPVQLRQAQSNPQVLPTQQVPQTQQMHLQTQFRHQQQQPSFSSSELSFTQLPAAASSVNDPTHFQGLPVAQDRMWRNKPAGT